MLKAYDHCLYKSRSIDLSTHLPFAIDEGGSDPILFMLGDCETIFLCETLDTRIDDSEIFFLFFVFKD